MKNFTLKIVTPKGIYKEVEVSLLNLNTTSGQLGILANHIPLASGLAIGSMNYIENGNRHHFAIGGGFVYVTKEVTTIIANSIESNEEIDINRANEAKERAQKRLAQKASDIDVKRAELALKKALNRISVKGL